MKIAVLGIGGVGFSIANLLAAAEYDVFGVDINEEVIKNPRMDPSTKRFINRYNHTINKHLVLTTDYSKTEDSDFAIILVNTGYDEEKQQLTINALESALTMLSASTSGTIAIISATIPLGASETLKSICDKAKMGYCYCPIMVVQGDRYGYIESFLNMHFLVLGAEPEIAQQVSMLFTTLYQKHSMPLPPTYHVPPATAELTKLVANAYLSTKMSFSNYFGHFCEQINTELPLSIDANLMFQIMGHDSRIGHSNLRAGFAFGGFCFPRDLRSLITSCQEYGSQPKMLIATAEVNDRRTITPADVLQQKHLIDEPRTITVLGTAYKTGLADERGSKTMELIAHLIKKGHNIIGYNPNMPDRAPLKSVLKDADVVIVTTDERLFKSIGPVLSKKCLAVCDFTAMAIVNESLIPENIEFFRAGRGWR